MTTIAALTQELGTLVATATGLPTSIDPIRPPSIPGCFVGPPAITPDDATGGRLLLAQWEIGALVPAVTGAWTQAAELGEAIAAAVIDHPTLGLVEVRSRLFAQGEAGDAPGYRIDVAVLLHQGALDPLDPSTMTERNPANV